MDETLLARYFANQCTPAEVRAVLAWFQTADGQTYLARQLRLDLRQADWHAPPDVRSPDADRLLRQIHARLPTEQRSEPAQADNGRVIPFRRWLSIAASVAVLLVSFGALWVYRQQPSEQLLQTAFGQKQTFRLPDESVVTLNGNSRLRFAEGWQPGQPREVWVEGEAFFDVTHQTNHASFTVHLPNRLDIRVLGTQFDVLARKTQTRVVLNSGHIRLDSPGWHGQQAVDMKPGELFEATHPAGKPANVVRRRVDPAVYASWQTSRLTFDNTSLAEIVQRLEDTYGLRIIVADERLLQQRFSGSVPSQNADVLLDGLAKLYGLDIRRQQQTITIKSVE